MVDKEGLQFYIITQCLVFTMIERIEVKFQGPMTGTWSNRFHVTDLYWLYPHNMPK